MSDDAQMDTAAQTGIDVPPVPPGDVLVFKVVHNDIETWFKIKRSTKLEKVMTKFCNLEGKTPASVRFFFKGRLVQPTDTPDTLGMLEHDTLEARTSARTRVRQPL
ncbi:hypothetical protein C8A03DRAFT_30891 [Achaetomium macrosporum]|uniref:Rad60/SUMO-like domain-containing protein n=1 Tax=Achaetomium macrosporum TaxID=79813 RepID=A0AAN7CF56_9PEZI|nr:hypothetical protein C8A03DRAFT_30891 [Achaetomium macrosporum]